MTSIQPFVDIPLSVKLLFISKFLANPSSNELYLSEVPMLITLALIFCDFNYPAIIQQFSFS